MGSKVPVIIPQISKNFGSLEATLKRSSLRSNVLSSQRKETSGTQPHSSPTPCIPACLGRREKNKTGLPAPFSLISLSPLVSLSPSSSLSLFFPKFLTYGIFTIFCYRLSLPTLYQLGYYPSYRLVFPFGQVGEAMGSLGRKPKLSTTFLSVLWNSKVSLKLKTSFMSRFRKLFPKDLLLGLDLESQSPKSRGLSCLKVV